VLLDYDRKRAAAKRGVGTVRVSLVGLAANSEKRNVIGIPDFVEALERLEKHDARTAEVAELRLIWGLTVPEIAAELGLSESTIERDWRFGRRWLASALGSSHPRR
jgi:DNA-directed RNA polymerase specialized sigma24 family protein